MNIYTNYKVCPSCNRYYPLSYKHNFCKSCNTIWKQFPQSGKYVNPIVQVESNQNDDDTITITKNPKCIVKFNEDGSLKE